MRYPVLILVLSFPIMLQLSFAQNPKDPDPDPPCPDCCPKNYSQEATHSYTIKNPKGTGGETVVIGERGDVNILYGSPPSVVDGKDLCFQYDLSNNAVNEWTFFASGGDDSDVCINDNNSDVWSAYGATVEYSFEGDAPGTTTGSKFIFAPPKPGDGGCDTYSLTAKVSEGGTGEGDCADGPCNVSDPPKESGVVNIRVYKCEKKSLSDSGGVKMWMSCPRQCSGFLTSNYEYTLNYEKCDGSVTATSLISSWSDPTLLSACPGADPVVIVKAWFEYTGVDGILQKSNVALGSCHPDDGSLDPTINPTCSYFSYSWSKGQLLVSDVTFKFQILMWAADHCNGVDSSIKSNTIIGTPCCVY